MFLQISRRLTVNNLLINHLFSENFINTNEKIKALPDIRRQYIRQLPKDNQRMLRLAYKKQE